MTLGECSILTWIWHREWPPSRPPLGPDNFTLTPCTLASTPLGAARNRPPLAVSSHLLGKTLGLHLDRQHWRLKNRTDQPPRNAAKANAVVRKRTSEPVRLDLPRVNDQGGRGAMPTHRSSCLINSVISRILLTTRLLMVVKASANASLLDLSVVLASCRMSLSARNKMRRSKSPCLAASS